MDRFSLICFEWSRYSGLVFEFFKFEIWGIDSSLFGLNISPDFFEVDVLWINFVLYDRVDY